MFSLNAISQNPCTIEDFTLIVPEAKIQYLRENKTAIIEHLGLFEFEPEEFETLIRENMNGSYFYNLEFMEDYNVAKFNIFLELQTVQGGFRKVLVSLKYEYDSKSLHLITMY